MASATLNLNDLRRLVADLKSRNDTLRREMETNIREIRNAEELIARSEQAIAAFAAVSAIPREEGLTIDEKIIAILSSASEAGLKTPELKIAIDRAFGGDLKRTSLQSRLTYLASIDGVIKRQNGTMRWQLTEKAKRKSR